MLRVGFTIVLIAVASSAFAQQPPQASDPALAVCQQLLSNANGQTIQAAVQGQNFARQVEDLKAELAKLKNEPPKDK